MDRVERVAHKTGNYLLDDVIAESNLYSGFPIMQFISLETGLAWRNNGSSSPKLLRYSIYSLSSITLFLLLLLPLFPIIFRRVLPLPTVSPHSFSPLHLYGRYYHLPASTQFINTLHSAFPLEIYFIIIFTPVLFLLVPRWAPVSFLYRPRKII